MPVADTEPISSSWADEVEEKEGGPLPPVTEQIVNGVKIVTEYKMNDDGKKVKVIRHYKIEKLQVSKSIAERKTWKKFGNAKGEKPGPNPTNTICAEEINMQFITGKEDSEPTDSVIEKLKAVSSKGIVKCRICKEDHWTTHCPFKDTLGPIQASLNQNTEEKKQVAASATAAPEDKRQSSGKYIPPSLRDGANKRGESMPSNRRDETAAIRVSNLSENTEERDLQELFKPFGSISRIFLAKDKATGHCKGFAFINFQKKDDAAAAINTLNGFGYDHLILNVEWSKPHGT